MDQSEEQFQDLIANLIPRVNKALSKGNTVPAIGLLLLDSGNVEVVLAVSEEEHELSKEIGLLQQGLIDKAREKSAVASCLAYPDYANQKFVAYLENNDLYCSKCLIPVVADPSPRLNVEGTEIEDGMIGVFGEGIP